MKTSFFSHCAGVERVPKELAAEVIDAIAAIDVPPVKGAAPRIRSQFLAGLLAHGWTGEVAVARGSDMTITSMKGDTGLCLQTGNMARMYADLMKLQTLYLDNAISAGIVVVPCQPLALLVGENIAQSTRLERELEIFRKAYHVPTLVFALE